MAYKRNPMRSERMGALSRFVLSLPVNAAITASTQWFERTLDDSANRRITIAQAFLAVDAILNIYLNVVDGLVVYPKMIHKRLMEELPFMATETILMEAVKRGGDRQDLHERIRVHSMEAGKAVKEQGKANDLIQRIEDDPAFLLSKEEIERILDPALFTGRCSEQVDAFMQTYIQPILKANADLLGEKGEVNV
jgi:adenylosuccinate lyase